jgi:hypothetical protein
LRSTIALRHRLAGAAGALLLQGGFILLLVASLPALRPPVDLGRELTLFLPRLIAAKPQTGPATLRAAPVIVTPALRAPEQAAPGITPAAPAPLPGLQSFGQALNGCAPQSYASLLPDQRAHCPRPGAGMAIQQLPDLLNAPPEAKDEALWQEQWKEAHWMPGLCGPGEETVVLCLMHQSIAEFERAEDVHWHLDRDKAAALAPPPPSVPERAGR